MTLLGIGAFGCGEVEVFIRLGDTSVNDTTPPTIESVQPPIGTVIFPGSTIAITVGVTDNRGVEEVRVVTASIPGVDFPDTTPLAVDRFPPFSFLFSFPTEGMAFLTFQAFDFAGNNSAITVTYQVSAILP
jgi:hypothetical protein